jgi:hypothetical protein
VEFLGRADGRTDLAGEKLDARHVADVLADTALACDVRPRFTMLSPERGAPSRYLLFVEAGPGEQLGNLERFAAAVDTALRAISHYDYCRRLGQLDALELVVVTNGFDRYERACIARGQRAGDVKPTALHPAEDWRKWMA